MNTSRRRVALLASSLLLGVAVPTAPAVAAGSAARSSKPKPAATTHKPAPKATVKPAPAKTAADPTPTLASRLAAVKVAKSINYYPSTAGWSAMWSNFDAVKIDADLAKAQSLGATNLRVLLFPATFGYPTPKADYLAKLNKLVGLADAHAMTVKFTLFDWWSGYSEVASSTAWASAILKPYKDDKRLIGVEIKNEFDPADAAGIAWAKKIVPAIRTVAPAMPLTFSVDGDTGAAGMAKIKTALGPTALDYYDFHFYGNSERALANIRRAQAAVAPTPVVIGEAGLNTLQNTEGEQAAFLARVFEGAKIAGVGSVAPWTLTDFTAKAIPTSDVSGIPAQYSYGLYHTDGSAKPAAAVVHAEWSGQALPADLLDLSFEAAAGKTPWRAYLPELGVAVKTQTVARTGKWSISFTNTGKTASGVPSMRVSPITPVQAGQKWHGEVWARGNAATGATQISLSWFDVKDKWLGGASSATLPVGTTSWIKLAVDGVAPAGSVSMQVHLKSGANKGTIWFDDVALASS